MNVPSQEACLDAEAWVQDVTFMLDHHQKWVAAFKEQRKPQFKSL